MTCNIFNINPSYSDFILLDLNVADNKLSFLVDTQADVSILKSSSITTFQNYNTSEKITIKGITNNEMSSLGSIIASIYSKRFEIKHKFHVMDNSVNTPSDGIIGKDFLKLYNCQICYESMKLIIHLNDFKISVAIYGGPKKNTIVLPARSEVIRKVQISNKFRNQFVDSQEILAGVFVARSIVTKENPLVRIINTTNDVQVIEKTKLKSENLDNFRICVLKTVEKNDSRDSKVEKVLSGRMPTYIREKLMPMCLEFSQIFALETDRMTVNNFYNQALKLIDNNPVYVKNYRLPYTQKVEIDTQIDKLLKNNLIEPSVSNYNSPLILVPKKGSDRKKWRMCVDYRLVNKKLIADKFPLPRIDDILDGLGRARYFSIVDLYSGFHQIPIEESSRNITSFSTEKGSFRWKVLPFGLNISPNSFSRMMSIAFAGITTEQAFLYIDDVIIVGCSENHHLQNIRKVFETFRKYNLKINPEKCQFFRPEVTFLGHRCTAHGLLPDNNHPFTTILL